MYHRQYGSGLSDIGEIYRGPVTVQRGRGGVANFFGGLLKYLLPVGSSAARVLTSQAVKSGGNVVRDLMGGKTLRDSLYDQGQNAINDLSTKGINKLKRMQKGRGLHTRHISGRSIKARRPRQKMLVGARKHSVLERLAGGPRRTRRKRKTATKKSRSRKKKKTVKQIGGRRKRRKGAKKGGRRKKATRSVDIFDI